MEGQEHPETGVPFERKQVEVDGKQYEVVVPEFESSYDAQLPENMYEATDREQFKECNSQLKNEVATNKDLREQFDDEQLEQIENGDTPDGYTWHHDAEGSILKHIKKLVILAVVPFGAAVQKADRRFDYGMEICKRT